MSWSSQPRRQAQVPLLYFVTWSTSLTWVPVGLVESSLLVSTHLSVGTCHAALMIVSLLHRTARALLSVPAVLLCRDTCCGTRMPSCAGM
jgi:hypothetical protein